MSTIQEQLREEAERLSGHSIRHGVAESGIASNLADAAADRIDALEAEAARCHARLEIDHYFKISDNDDLDLERVEIPMEQRDGISGRDATIEILAADNAALRAEKEGFRDKLATVIGKLMAAEKALEPFASWDVTEISVGSGTWQVIVKASIYPQPTLSNFASARTTLQSIRSEAK